MDLSRNAMKRGNLRLQSAVDYLVSLGLGILVLSVSLFIIFSISVNAPAQASPNCASVPGFSCGFYSLSSNGVLAINLAQALGGNLKINGIACSSQFNSSGNGPLYGNSWVTANSLYYPATFNPPVVYTDTYDTFNVYCFNSGGLAAGPLGNYYTGYLWLNYTIEGSSGFSNKIEQVVSLTAKYT